MSIPRDTIELIRERSQIEEIVKRYVPSLQKKGKDYSGLCPFHKEKTPSFTVSAEKQIFYCFGCHEGGNVFSFISKMEKLTFPESVRFLGNLLGIQVKDEFQREQAPESGDLLKINQTAMLHYHAALKSGIGRTGREYILKRGVAEASIAEFKLGYAPDEWHYLSRHLQGMRVPLSRAVELGLLSENIKEGKSNYYDRFRGRIIFPIFSQKNEIIAFGGRIIEEGNPKYLNSPESELFKKGNVLYGFNLAREHIASLKRAIVVEGYLDVIGCHQAGIKNVVAPLGTALTPNQVRLLSRQCVEIILLFDADSAGINASLRSLEIMKDINVDVRVAVLPEADPFEFIAVRGMREFMAVVDSAMKPVDFKIERVIADSRNKKRTDMLTALYGIIREIEFETERSLYLKKISGLLKIDEKDIRADFKRFLDASRVQGSYTSKLGEDKPVKDRADYLVRAYRELVVLVCHYPELVEQAMIDFSERDIPDEISANIFRKIGELFSGNERISIDRLFDFFPDGEEGRFLEENALRVFKIDNPGAAYTEIYINLKLYLIDEKIDRYAELIKNTNPDKKTDIKEYLTEIEVLRREREKLSTYVYNKRII